MDEVDAFLADIRAAYASEPEEAVASRHLAAIAREAELVHPLNKPKQAAWRRTMIRNRFLRPVATLGAAMLAAILGTAGLAVAGVDLPDQATTAFERVGVTLPNQAGGGQSGEHARSDEVHSVIDATPPSERGCEFGHSVAEAANGDKALPEQAQDACENGDGDENGNAAHPNQSSHSEFGRNTAERAKTLGDATTEQRQSFGQDTADQAKELGGAPAEAPTTEQQSETHSTGAPEGTPDGPPDAAPVPDGTPTGPPDGTPSGRP
jgi:hypothetical protein